MSGQVSLQSSSVPRGLDLAHSAAPAVHLHSPYAVSTHSTMSSLNPRNAAVTDLSDCLKNVWEAIVSFFKSLMHCFGLFSKPSEKTPEIQREFRLHKDDYQIQRSLVEQRLRAAQQMAQEPVKQFQLQSIGLLPVQPEEMRVGNYEVGISHFIGHRDALEDEHLAASFDLVIRGQHYPIQLFGIFDGHGGATAARYVSDNLRRKLSEALREFNANGLTQAGIWKALKMAFVRLNEDFKNLHGETALEQGTTATVAMILNNQLWTANVGDSRTVLDNNGTAEQLSYDAKPNDPRVRRKIENRGGKVIDVRGVDRINGDLAVGGAFGDFRLKGAVSARPTITCKPLAEIQRGTHLILCCDGVYDVARTVDIVNAAHANRRLSAGRIAEKIVSSAFHSNSMDNLSAMVVKIR